MLTFKINQKHKQHLLTRVIIARSKRHRGLVISWIRVDGRKRNESGYVWMRKLLNPQQNVCGYKRIRIRVDGASEQSVHNM